MAATTTLDAATQMVRSAIRDTDGDSYATTDIQRHIRFVLEEFVRIARPTRAIGSVTITAATATLDIISTIAAFHPSRFLRASIGYYPIEAVDYQHVARLHTEEHDSAQPEKIAFREDNIAVLYPTPDVQYIASIAYVVPLGTLAESASVIPIENDLLHMPLFTGVPASLRYAAREQLFASAEWQQFVAYAQAIYRTALSPGMMRLNEEGYI